MSFGNETDKKYLIMNTMLKLVKENGLQGTAMSKLAKKAGIAAGTIYHYFESKEELINSMYLESKLLFGKAINQVDWSKDSFKEVFKDLGEALFTFFVKNPEIFFFVEQCMRTPYLRQETIEEGKKYYKPVLTYLQKGIDQGIVKDLDVSLLASLIYGSLATAINLYLQGDPSINIDNLEQVFSYAWDGIKKE